MKVNQMNLKIISILLVFFLCSCTPTQPVVQQAVPQNNPIQDTPIRVASWNLQIFGEDKASNNTLMEFYASEIRKYDVFLVQEIRDISGQAFNKLCSMVPEYNCMVSDRLGRTTSKEQYGIIYKKGMTVTIKQYVDVNDYFEREPIYIFTSKESFALIHTKPTDATNEINHMLAITNYTIIGDLNADCDYYKGPKERNWLINEDTTTGKTVCTYDQIISYNRYPAGVDCNVIGSDHCLIWLVV